MQFYVSNSNRLAQAAFYLLTAFIIVLFFNACSPDREVVQVLQGPAGANGADGISCSVAQTEGGALLSCSDGSETYMQNGLPGAEGPQGIPGQDGSDGDDGSSGATLRDYSANSCTNMLGTTKYVKKNGSNFKFYSHSSCSSSSAFAEVSQGEAYWVSATSLAVHADSVIRVITFGGN
jgi:hypothetical protein